MIRRHAFLAAALTFLALWAFSNRVYLGDWLVLSYPLPDFLLRTVLAWFRAEGRFFWPTAWLLAAFGVAGVLASYRPRTALPLLAAALLLQWVDLGIWRERLGTLAAKPPISAFGSPEASAAIEAEIAALGAAGVIPAIPCTAQFSNYGAPPTIAAIELQLLAARGNAAMPGIVTARTSFDCPAQAATPLRTLAATGLLLVLAQPSPADRRTEARRDLACRETLPGLVCVPR